MDYPNEWIILPDYPPSIPVLPIHLRGAGALFWRAQVLGFRGRLEEALRVGGSQVERCWFQLVEPEKTWRVSVSEKPWGKVVKLMLGLAW
jgi:hypothetical protein